jgi:hypothetical protein
MYSYNNKHLLRSNIKGYDGKTHQNDSQNSDTTASSDRECTICSSRSRRPVRKLLVTTSPECCHPFRFYDQNFVRIYLSIRVAWLVYLIHDLITITIFGEEYKLWSSSPCNFPHTVTSSLSCLYIHLTTLFSNTPTPSSFSGWQTKLQIH